MASFPAREVANDVEIGMDDQPSLRGARGRGVGSDDNGDEGSHIIRVFVAEPTTLIREGLVALLGREHDIAVIAVVQRGEKIIPAVRKLEPDVALLAGAFPGHDGINIARAIGTALPACRCAIVSMDRQPAHLQRAIAAKVPGYLVHDASAAFLIAAVRQLAMGKKVIDPGLTYSALASTASPLTLREADALRAVAKGFTTEEVAASLCLTTGTIRNYLSRAIAKVGARNRVDAIRRAEESGWL